MNDYAEAAFALRHEVDHYFQATVRELAGKLPAREAIELGRAALRKAIDVAAEEALNQTVHNHGGEQGANALGSDQSGAQEHAPATRKADHADAR